MKNSLMLGLFAETFIHAGIGQTQSAIDLPVAREETTGFPYIAGSSFKGALKDLAAAEWPDPDPGKSERHDTVLRLFGHEAAAGHWLVSDIRLLLLPVRCLTESYRWATCPLILSRFARDLKRADPGRGPADLPPLAPPSAADKAVVIGAPVVIGTPEGELLHLEEFAFHREQLSALPDDWLNAFRQVMTAEAAGELQKRLVILDNDRFAWFARHGLPVRARNALDLETKTVKDGALWYEEYLPPDTVMYALLGVRPGKQSERAQAFSDFHAMAENANNYIQLGGDETVGLGWFKLTRPAGT